MDTTARQDVSDSTFELLRTLGDGTRVRLQLLGEADRADLLAGFAQLSGRSRHLRFFSAMPELPEQVMDRLLATDPDCHVAIGARIVDADGRVRPPIVGVARYFRGRCDQPTAEPSVAVVDAFHGRGLGRLLLRALGRYARSRGVTTFRPHTLADNARVRRILAAVNGVPVAHDGAIVTYDVDLRPREPASEPSREARPLVEPAVAGAY